MFASRLSNLISYHLIHKPASARITQNIRIILRVATELATTDNLRYVNIGQYYAYLRSNSLQRVKSIH